MADHTRPGETTMKAFEIMNTKMVTCQSDDNVGRAAQLMWEQGCGCLPVLDARRRVVGLLSDRDACMAAYTQGLPLQSISVATAMPRTLSSCGPDAELDDVLRVMMTNSVHRVLVLDSERQLLGLIALTDIARTAGSWDIKSEIDLAKVALTLGEVARRRHPATPVPAVDSPDLTDVVRHSLESLKALRDEIRVDLNLAGKELRDQWHRLEDEIRLAERRARDARSEGAWSLGPVIENVKRFRNAFRSQEAAAP